MAEVLLDRSERLRQLAAEMYRRRPDRVSHVSFDRAALADAAERLYGRRPECHCLAEGWRLRFHFADPPEAVHFKLRFG